MKKAKKGDLITIFAPHYFEGENSLRNIKNKTGKFWVFDELSGKDEGVTKLMEFMGIAEDDQPEFFNRFIKEKYPDMYNVTGDLDWVPHIMGLQYYQEKGIEEKIAKEIYEDAIQVLDSSSGDDSYYDYDPGYAEYITYILIQLGDKKRADSLTKILNNRE